MRCLFPLVLGVLCWTQAGWAAEAEVKPRDTLVFKDGDRVQGKLVTQAANIIVFQSDRFGELHVPVGDAVIIPAEKPAGPPPMPVVVTVPSTPLPASQPPALGAMAEAKPETKAEAAATESTEAEKVSLWEKFSPAVLTADLRKIFGPWHGRLAFSNEIVSDTADRDNLSLESQLKRKWKLDEVQLNGHYDFSSTNHLTTTDLLKADGLWRHDFPKNYFALYRPSLEWNRASFTNGRPSDYVLMQQEIGVGISLLSTPARKVRLGVSENLFDLWNTGMPGAHTSRTVESAFVETELKLLWGMLLTERGVYYYSFSTGREGWENHLELTKKFTETLSTAIRYETRYNSPDGRAQDFNRLKLLFGVDF